MNDGRELLPLAFDEVRVLQLIRKMKAHGHDRFQGVVHNGKVTNLDIIEQHKI